MMRSARQWILTITGIALVVSGVRGRAQVTAQVNLVKTEQSTRVFTDKARVVVWLTSLDNTNVLPKNPDNAKRYQMVQQNKRFEPALLVIPVGAVVDFPNKDPWFHNVFSLYQGKRFDLGLYQAGSTHAVRFDRLGASYIFCNIHPQMSAVVLAIDSDQYGISDAAGRVVLGNIAPGRYRLHVWYQGSSQKSLDAMQREVVISGAKQDLGTLQVLANAPSQVAHKNKYGQDYDREDTSPAY